MRLRLALALLLLPARSQPEIDVRLLEDSVVVRAVRAPLDDVLTRFAQATGADIVYDPARPRQLVTLTIEARTAAEAVEKLLEGQGLNYVVRLDPSGRKVEMLVVVGGARPSFAAGRTGRPGSPPPAEEEAEPGEVEEPFAPGEDLAPPPALPVEGATQSGGGAASPGAPGGAIGPEPSSPESPGYEPPPPEQPQPPAPASYPGAGPPSPAPPVYPGPASYPPGGH
jgi:hypothetical protein